MEYSSLMWFEIYWLLFLSHQSRSRSCPDKCWWGMNWQSSIFNTSFSPYLLHIFYSDLPHDEIDFLMQDIAGEDGLMLAFREMQSCSTMSVSWVKTWWRKEEESLKPEGLYLGSFSYTGSSQAAYAAALEVFASLKIGNIWHLYIFMNNTHWFKEYLQLQILVKLINIFKNNKYLPNYEKLIK